MPLRHVRYSPKQVFVERLIWLAWLCFLTSLCGCLRYVPSREDIEKDQSSEKSAVITEAAFSKDDRLQRNRLVRLVAERTAATPAEGTYRVGPQDLLQFEVFDVPELNRSVRVRPTGQISLPLIGSLEVAGLTESEMQDEVSSRLEKFLQAPQVTVFIQEYGAKKVSVIGEVARPGTYNLKRENYSLIEILSESGGRTDRAAGFVVLVPAKSSSDTQRAPVESFVKTGNSLSASETSDPIPETGIEIAMDDLTGSGGRAPLSVPLCAGDTIVVPEAGMVQVDGEVKTPGSYKLASRMTLLGAIASAGSLTYSADVHKVEVIRELSPGEKGVLLVDLEQLALGSGTDVRLRDGDVVRVPSAEGRFITRQVVDGISSILNLGVSTAR